MLIAAVIVGTLVLLAMAALSVVVVGALDVVRRDEEVEPVWSLPVLATWLSLAVGPVTAFALSVRTMDDRDSVVLAYELLLTGFLAPVFLAMAVVLSVGRWAVPGPRGAPRPPWAPPTARGMVGASCWLAGSVVVAWGLGWDALWGLPAAAAVLVAGVGGTARREQGREVAWTWVVAAQLAWLAGSSLALSERVGGAGVTRWALAAGAVVALGAAVRQMRWGWLACVAPAAVVAVGARFIGGPSPCQELPELVDLQGRPSPDLDRFLSEVTYGNTTVIERRAEDAGYRTDHEATSYPDDRPYGLVHAHADVAVNNLPIDAPLQLAGGRHVWTHHLAVQGLAVVVKQAPGGAWVSTEDAVVPLGALTEVLTEQQAMHGGLLRGRCSVRFVGRTAEPHCVPLPPSLVPKQRPDPSYVPDGFFDETASAAFVVVSGPSPWTLQQALSICVSVRRAGFEACHLRSLQRAQLPSFLLGPSGSIVVTPEPPYRDAVGLVSAQEP